MSASLRTKDGSFSVTGAILASEKAAGRFVSIDLDGALNWARENKLNLKRDRRSLDRINALRAQLRLPPFKLIYKEEGKLSVQPPVAGSTPMRLLPIVASQDELLERIAAYTGTLTGLVTPEIARWLLDLNTGNRPLEHKAVERFRKILSNGDWLNTGEPAIVSRDGILNDGQHRLSAIRASGIAAELDVRFGIERAAFRATGTGRRRTASNVLRIEGYSNTSCQAAIAPLLHYYDTGTMGQNHSQVETTEVLEIVETDDRICEIAARIQRSKFKPTRTGPFGFVLVVAARTAPLDQVFEFADLVSSGVVENESDPARRLHVRLRDVAMRKERIGQLDNAILMVKAWNAWAQGRTVSKLQIIESDRSNAGFPKVREWPAGGRPVAPQPALVASPNGDTLSSGNA